MLPKCQNKNQVMASHIICKKHLLKITSKQIALWASFPAGRMYTVKHIEKKVAKIEESP